VVVVQNCALESMVGLDAVENRKFVSPCQESNPSHQAHSIVTILTELSWLLNMFYLVSHTCHNLPLKQINTIQKTCLK
jgi:hypothetical protein